MDGEFPLILMGIDWLSRGMEVQILMVLLECMSGMEVVGILWEVH